MLKVGLLSDTHGVFGEPFKDFFRDVDVLWHAGDFGGPLSFASRIREFKPLVGVYGNCDGQDYRREFPSFQLLCTEGKRVLMTHIGGSPGHYDIRAAALIEAHRPDIFICGHSHILKVMEDRSYGMLYLNPGAAGIQGWQVVRTALRFDLDAGEIKNMEVFNLPR